MPQQFNLGDVCKLYYSVTLDTPTFVKVEGLMSMDPPGFEFGVIERKLLEGNIKQKRPGKAEGEDGTITVEYSGSNALIKQIATWAKAGRPPLVLFALTFEDGSDITWVGFFKGLKPKDVDEDSQVGTDIGYEVTEIPDYHEESTLILPDAGGGGGGA